MKRTRPFIVICLIQFIFSFTIVAQRPELTPTIQVYAPNNKSAAISKKQTTNDVIGNVISNGNILKSISTNQLSSIWGKYLSTSYNDRFYASAIDNDGNVISVGSIGAGSSDVDAFIYKCDASGNKLWSDKPATSSSTDGIYDVTTDKAGNIFITGQFCSSAFNSYLYSNGNADVFVAKYDPDGNLIWVTQGGGSNKDYGCGIKTDGNGDVYVVGFFNGTASFSGVYKTSSSQGDMFIAKYSGSNGNLDWIRTGDIGENNYLFGIGVDSTGNVYVGTTFIGTVSFSGSPIIDSSGSQDMLLIKYNTNGDFQWIKTGGGTGDDGINRTVVCPDGNVLVAGYFSGTAQFDTKTLTAHGSYDIFTAKYSPSGNLIWAKQFGGTGSQSAWGLCADEKNNCYLTGWFSGTGAFDNTTIYSSGSDDAYLIKYDKNGNLIWVESIATGSDDQYGNGVDVSGNDIVVAGRYNGDSYIYGSYFANGGGEDGFIAKFFQSEDPNTEITVNPNLFISTPQVKTGESITFTGKQFSPAGKVDLNFTGSGILNPITDYSVDVYGNFEYTLKIASAQNIGMYQVTATDKISGKSTTKSFQIIPDQSTVSDDDLKIVEPNMSKARYVGDPITLSWEDQAKFNVNPTYNLKDSYKVEYKKDANNSSGMWQLIGNIQGINPGYGKIIHSTAFTPIDAGSYMFRITDNYYPNRSVTTPEIVVNGSLNQDIRVEFRWDYNSMITGLSPEGVAADGVARFYMVVSNINPLSGIQKVKVALSDPDGYMATQFLGKVMYCSAQNDNAFSPEADNANSINAENNSSNPDGKYWFWYVAPDDFSRNEGDWDKGERLITATFNVTLLNGQTLSPIKKEIKIVRPPLMLVHGLNSSSVVWDNFHIGNNDNQPTYKDDPRFVIKKAIDLNPTAHFNVNATHLLGNVGDPASFMNVLNDMHQSGYASNRVDYICHSMGGCVARLASENSKYKVQQNYGKGYINKLITLDTPHDGSSLANLLDDMANDVGRNGLLISLSELINKKWPEAPKFWNIEPLKVNVTDAIADLRYSGGIKFKETLIHSHLVGCGSPCESSSIETFGIYNLLKTWLSFGTLQSILPHCTWYQNYFEKHHYESDFNDLNDGIVSLSSQFSGDNSNNIPISCSYFYGPMHCKPFGVSPVDTPDIWALVNVLLNTKINSSLFNYISATNVSSKSVLIPQNKSFAIVDDKIKILYPQPNAVYNAGDTITIKLQIDTLGLQNFALIVQDQSFFDKPTKTNLEYKLIVSPEYIEGQSISVIGGYSNQDTSYISNTSINLKVNPVGSILDFNIKPEVFVIEKGKSRRPDYEAIFPNAIAQLGYTDKLTVKINDPNLLAYDETTNEFKGLAKGSTQATVTYMGITKTVFFEIIQYEEPAGDPITGINEMQADKKDELIVKAYPNPFTESVTIEYSLPDIGETRLEIFDIYGQKIKEVNFGNEPKGPYKKVVELNSLPAGIYIYKLTSGKAIQNGNIIKVSQLKK